MKRLFALFDLFRKGSAVANPEAWKYGQITVTAVGGLLLAVTRLLDAFGYTLALDQAAIDTLAAAVLVLVNLVLTPVTSDKIGLPAKPRRPEPGGPAGDRAGDDEPATERRTDFGGA